MRVIICGGRNIGVPTEVFHEASDLFRVFVHLNRIHANTPISAVIEGGQRTWEKGRIVGGADYLAWEWAARNEIECITVEAEWHNLSHPDSRIRTSAGGRRYDANAGPRRNTKMLALKPDAVIAFPGGAGTADMIRQARTAGVQVIEPLKQPGGKS